MLCGTYRYWLGLKLIVFCCQSCKLHEKLHSSYLYQHLSFSTHLWTSPQPRRDPSIWVFLFPHDAAVSNKFTAPAIFFSFVSLNAFVNSIITFNPAIKKLITTYLTDVWLDEEAYFLDFTRTNLTTSLQFKKHVTGKFFSWQSVDGSMRRRSNGTRTLNNKIKILWKHDLDQFTKKTAAHFKRLPVDFSITPSLSLILLLTRSSINTFCEDIIDEPLIDMSNDFISLEPAMSYLPPSQHETNPTSTLGYPTPALEHPQPEISFTDKNTLLPQLPSDDGETQDIIDDLTLQKTTVKLYSDRDATPICHQPQHSNARK